MKRIKERIKYEIPSITALNLHMEQGIAATSTGTINPGNSGTPNQPKVDDWTDSGYQNKDYDL